MGFPPFLLGGPIKAGIQTDGKVWLYLPILLLWIILRELIGVGEGGMGDVVLKVEERVLLYRGGIPMFIPFPFTPYQLIRAKNSP